MKTMKWLIRRELWEHKGMLLWTPAAVAAIMTLLAAAMLVYSLSDRDFHVDFQVNNHAATFEKGVAPSALDAPAIATKMADGYMLAATPLYLMLGQLVFLYCLGALYEERRDKSVLFWKSLPVSDTLTVISKVALALLVAPAITLAAGTAAALLMLLFTCLGMSLHGAPIFSAILARPEFYLAPLRVAAMLPIYALWALPTVGWLLMVSAWARSKAFLWAVGAPLLTGLLTYWANAMFDGRWNIAWLMSNIVGRLLLSVIPGSWLGLGNAHGGDWHGGVAAQLSDSWSMLGQPGLWIGAAAGIAMLGAAIWLRKWRQED
ncbi:ABC-2 type transport system permease protein [Oxalobacteraceae bacterium GrIS 1.11]